MTNKQPGYWDHKKFNRDRRPSVNNKRHGRWFVYDDNGDLRWTNNWIYDVKNGMEKEYFPDGSWYSDYYVDGLEEGEGIDCK